LPMTDIIAHRFLQSAIKLVARRLPGARLMPVMRQELYRCVF
jgi:hypothetical protein